MKPALLRKLPKIFISVLLLIFTLFPLSASLSASGSAPANASGSACTYTIPTDVAVVDGLDNYAQVKGGDVLCLPAGTRGNIKLMNLHGTDGNPITVRNEGGMVYITGTQFLTGGIGVIDSSYLHVTGTGVSEKCGAEYLADKQECGIELDQTHKGIKIDTAAGNTSHLEIDHISIHDTSTISETRGIAIHPLDQQVIVGLYIHHNYVANTSAEGIYVGTEPHGRPLELLGKEQDVEISYNLLENIGFDGIKIKQGEMNVDVHHNVIHWAGLAGVANHVGGIKLAHSVGDYYNNFVLTGCEGIKMGRTIVNPGTRYFNNVVVGAKCGGIQAPEDGALVYNNTIVDSDLYGISAAGANSQVFDNMIAGATGVPLDGLAETFYNNWVGTLANARFTNPAAYDFHPLDGSPAIEGGRNTGTFPTFDLDGRARPVSRYTDLGAYEYPIPYTHFIFFPRLQKSDLP